MLTLAFNNKAVKAVSGTIYIRADGSIEGTTNIKTDDRITYVFTANISDSVIVERSNITIDGKGYTLQGSKSGKGMLFSSINHVIIRNINITNFAYGIYLDSSSYITVSDNNAIGNGNGICLDLSSNNTVSGNNADENLQDGIRLKGSSYNNVSDNSATENYYGIALERSSNNNTLSRNSVTGNNDEGIWLSYSSNNTIRENNITEGGDGVYLEYSSGNMICENNMTANDKYGVYLESPNNTVYGNNMSKNEYGVCLESTYDDFSRYNTVSGNDITNNRHGVYLWSSKNNTVCGNNIVHNTNDGIWFHESSSYNWVYGNNITNSNDGVCLDSLSNVNVFCGNNIMNNSYGVYLLVSKDNMIYHNYFANNTEQVYSSNSTNVWNGTYPYGGNCWSDYPGVDEKSGQSQNQPGSDGIGDTPHTRDGNFTDGYPLMSPHNVAVTNVTSFKTVVGQGFCVNMSVTVANWGTYEEDARLSVSANSTCIAENATTLTVGNAAVVEFAWNTSGYALGNYSIGACALPFPGETSFSGYNCTDYLIIVSKKGDLTGTEGTNVWDFVPDSKADMKDVSVVAKCFEPLKTVTPAHSNCDVSGKTPGLPDGVVDMKDLGLVCKCRENPNA